MSTPSTQDAAAEWHPSVNPWLIAVAVMVAVFMEVLDTTITSVALPNMAGSLSSTNDEATWVLTSYLVANAIVLPASNWCSLKFGRKRFLMTCVAIFTVARFSSKNPSGTRPRRGCQPPPAAGSSHAEPTRRFT